jgi:outer membrane protein assembly factor BamC
MIRCPSLRRLALLPILGATLFLSGCSWLLDDEGWIQDRRGEYREARETRPPEIPEDLDDRRIQEAMVVPDVVGMERYREQEEFELPRPATLFTREQDRGVRIQRFDDRSWIVAPDPPATVWPRVKQFLSDNGIAVVAEAPRQGIMESEWFLVEDDEYRDVVRSTIVAAGNPEPRQRLRLRVEQAVRRGATEIHLSQYGAPTIPDGVDWDSAPSGPAGDELLRELAGYLAAEVGAGSVSLVAQEIAAEAKAEVLRTSEAPPTLRLRLDFPRAWATVASALENAEITVDAAEREARVYRIRYNEAQFRGDEQGWFARLFDFGAADPEAPGEPYVLRLEPAGNGFDVRVLDEDEDPVGRETSEQILLVLREFAS